MLILLNKFYPNNDYNIPYYVVKISYKMIDKNNDKNNDKNK